MDLRSQLGWFFISTIAGFLSSACCLRLFVLSGSSAASVWLPAGILMALFLLLPKKNWGAILLGAVIGCYAANRDIGRPVTIAFLNTLNDALVQALLPALVFRRLVSRGAEGIFEIRGAVIFTLVCFFSSLLSGVLGATTLQHGDMFAGVRSPIFRLWSASTFLGQLSICPAVVAWLLPGQRKRGYAKDVELLVVALPFILALAVLVQPVLLKVAPLLLFVPFAAVFWASFVCGRRAGTLSASLVVFSLAILSAMGLALSVPSVGSLSSQVALFSAFGAILASSNLLLIALVEGRERDFEQRVALEQSVAHLQQTHSLGIVSAGVAHDVNNMLAALSAFEELLRRHLESRRDRDTDRYLDGIRLCIDRAKGVVQQMRRSTGASLESAREDVSLKTIVEESVHMLTHGPDLGDISFDVDVPKSDTLCLGDRSQLHQVVFNLLLNAKQAIGDSSGKIRTRLTRVERVPEDIAHALDREIRGPALILEVHDTGPGIPEHLRGKIFAPFFSNKQGGSGLGLSVVQRIVHAHLGAIGVGRSDLGGAQFNVAIPLRPALQQAPVVKESSGVPAFSVGALRVLLVDDERVLVTATAKLLSSVVADVWTFTSPNQALLAFKRNPQAFDLAVVDRLMPELSGPQLIKELRRLQPGLPVVGLSGALGEQELGAPAFPQDVFVLAKPFSFQDLLRALELHLDRSKPRKVAEAR